MRSVLTWSDKVPDRDGIKSVCYDVAFKPDGTQIVTGVGSRVQVYDAVDGDLLHSLKGHKDSVYSVAYSRDGKRFSSGGADKTIIIWTHKAEGILKYSHNDSIQALEYNPVTQQLASATMGDFGLWSPEQKSVAKHKVSSRILCMSWTNDGQYLALGQFNGNISVRDKSGSEKVLIERTAPVWSICWNPSRDEPYDILACGCWDGTLSFYQLSGIQVGKDKELGYDPCSVAYFSNGEYICIGGTDKKVGLVTKEGTRLTTVAERETWVWCVKPRPKQNYVVIGCEDGTIAMYQLIFSTVHGLYQDRYAYRDFMTDVIIQHLITEQKVRIKCRDYVKKIAVYKGRLAVQLPDRVIIYELSYDDAYDMHYRVSTKIQKRLECNLLVVTSQHVILCQEKKLQLYTFEGEKEREWVLESVIRYIKVVGGPSGKEGLLIGLKSGLVLKIFINNQFPIQLIKHTNSIRCLDLSASRSKLAVVDENTNAMVYDLLSKELLFEEKSANSVAWNTEMEEMFCFSGNGMLSIKTGSFPVHQQKLQGFVVGFKGSKIFCLHYVCMQTIDVPQSASLYRYLEKNDFATAYRVACLGVTENDWRLLAMQALQGMSLEIARKAYIRVRDMRYIELLNRIEHGRRHGKDENLFMAEILAYQQKYQEAAKMYARSNKVELAMEMFSDLRQFEEAKVWAEQYSKEKGGDTSSVQELINRQAQWSEEVNDYEAAADMYIKAKKFDRAIAIIGKNSWSDKLVEVMRQLPKSDTKLLATCAAYFRKWADHAYAKETYIKLNDLKSLLGLHVDSNKWEEAFTLLKSCPEHKDKVYLPYAKFLGNNDRFEEARLAYKKAGKPEQSSAMLEQLCHNAVIENRFKDAGYFFWLLAKEMMDSMTQNEVGEDMDLEQSLVDQSEKDHALMHRFRELHARSQAYYAYHFVYISIEEPFHSVFPSTLLNIGRFLLCKFTELQQAPTSGKAMPLGISLAYTLQTLAKHGEQLEAFKTARYAYNKLQGLKIPTNWIDELDLACIITRSKPFSDKEDLLPVCYRCGTVNPLLNSHGDVCINCGAAFIRSFVTFEHLPLVEFELDHTISDTEAMQLLEAPPPKGEGLRAVQRNKQEPKGDGFKERRHKEDVQTLRFDRDDEEEEEASDEELLMNMDDPFQQQMAVPHTPIKATKQILMSLERTEVLVRTWPTPAIPNQYFRIMDPDLPMVIDDAGNFYEQEEYEQASLEQGYSPFTRESPDAIKKPGEGGGGAWASGSTPPQISPPKVSCPQWPPPKIPASRPSTAESAGHVRLSQ